MRDLVHTGQKQMELQSELYDESKKELRLFWLSLDWKKAGGQKPWSVIAVCEMCKTYLQMA